MHKGDASGSVNAIVRRSSELFGPIATEKAAIRLVHSSVSEAIIKCRLEQIDNILVAISLTDPPAVALDISGSIKKLLRRRGHNSFTQNNHCISLGKNDKLVL
jgi:RNase P/RNase MRP subunit POP5